MMRKAQTVTQGPWAVSGTSPAYKDGVRVAGFQLSVSREIGEPDARGIRRRMRGDADGMLFPNTDAGFAYALERGYLTGYYPRTWCPKHRTLHFWIGNPHGPAAAEGLTCWTREDLRDPRGALKRRAAWVARLIRSGMSLSMALFNCKGDPGPVPGDPDDRLACLCAGRGYPKTRGATCGACGGYREKEGTTGL